MGLIFDNIYNDLFTEVYHNGTWVKNGVRTKYIDGTPAYYKQVIGVNFRFDNSTDIAPILSSRVTPLNNALKELYWIWILQSNDVNVLNSLGCKFWDEWRLEDNTIGNSYGYQIKKKTFGHESQLHYVISELKRNPNSRRIMTEIWAPEELHKMALTPCVHLTQWSVVDDKLYLEVRQRSSDLALGLVSNVFQYSILHKLVALECWLKPADLIWNIHNLHYYDRHESKLLEQLSYSNVNTFNVEINNFNGIFNFKPEDVKIKDYSIKNKINYEVAI